jgi:hypothetical protein
LEVDLVPVLVDLILELGCIGAQADIGSGFLGWEEEQVGMAESFAE